MSTASNLFRSQLPSLEESEFNEMRELIFQLAGIRISESKKILITSRLGKRLYALGLNSWSDYIAHLKAPGSSESTEFVNALTTNKSEFFREKAHFEYLEKIFLPERFQKDQSPLYVWDGACSYGQEVYTTVITLEKFKAVNQKHFTYNILATDIDTHVLTKAQKGLYSAAEIERYVPKDITKQYFKPARVGGENQYLFDQQLAKSIKFRQLNLCDPNQNIPLRFDVVLLRNVLIYFDKPTIEKVIKKAIHHLKDDGIIIIGHCENIPAAKLGLESPKQAVYRRRRS